MNNSKIAAGILGVLLLSSAGLSQRPSDPALLIPQEAPELAYVPVADPLTIPEGVNFGLSADLRFDSRGHLWVLNRGPQPVAEFDADGRFVRAFGEGLFGVRPHGIYVDDDGNVWVADGSTHIVVKFNAAGEVLFTLGTRGQRGDWNEAAGTRLLNEPNGVAVAANGDFFIVQGHNPAAGDPRVLKFDKDGNFLKTWGGKGTAPGQFAVAHGVSIDARGLLWVMDRENQRIQIFDAEGAYVREMKYAGLPCGIDIGNENIWMVNGFTGQLLQLDLEGNVLAALGRPGNALGEFGEAHYVAVSPRGEIFIADVVKGVQKFIPR